MAEEFPLAPSPRPPVAEVGPAAAVTVLLERELPVPVRIESMRRLTGGASRETWSFDAVDAEGRRHPLILRRDFPDGRSQNPDVLAGRKDPLDRVGEYLLLARLHADGIPVPRPVAVPRPGDELTDCYVMERVDGETRPWVIVGDEFAGVRPRLVAQLGGALARIHSYTAEDLPFLPLRPVEGQLDLVSTLLDQAGPQRPALEAGLRWCRERLPILDSADRPMRLVHGDFRTTNYAVGRHGLQAVFDWEFSHIGHPATDLAFVCLRSWRFGADEREVTGIGSREEFFAAYEAAGGMAVDAEQVRAAEVLCTLVTAGIFLSRTRGFRTGEERTVEAAAIGRRIAELEYDLLRLLD